MIKMLMLLYVGCEFAPSQNDANEIISTLGISECQDLLQSTAAVTKSIEVDRVIESAVSRSWKRKPRQKIDSHLAQYTITNCTRNECYILCMAKTVIW